MHGNRLVPVLIVAASVLALAACTPAKTTATETATGHPRSTETPSPSVSDDSLPTSVPVPKPTSLDDARAQIGAAIVRYDAVADRVAAGTATPALIDMVAADAAAADLRASKPIQGAQPVPTSMFVFLDERSASGAAVPYGKLTEFGCVASGHVSPSNGERASGRTKLTGMAYVLEYIPSDQRWVVSSTRKANEPACTNPASTATVDAAYAAVDRLISAEAAAGDSGVSPAQADALISRAAGGSLAKFLRDADPVALRFTGLAGLTPRLLESAGPSGSGKSSGAGANIFACVTDPDTHSTDGDGQAWPPGNASELGISSRQSTGALYISSADYFDFDACTY